jgi:Na+/H+ antiporter NhaD/arsenite permease-like protein
MIALTNFDASWVALAIFAATYFVIAVGSVPGLRVDRTGAAIIGAGLMVGAGVLTMDEAWRAIHYDTILLLFGMMIVVANLRLAGFFQAVAVWVIRHAHRPILLLAAVVLVSGVLSAFFVNDTMCLVLTPLVLEVTLALRRNPIPYLLGVAMASNVGSVATITGNPQNMMIGSFSGIPYAQFMAALAPVAGIGMALTVAVIAVVYRKEFASEPHVEVKTRRVAVHRALLWKSVIAAAAMVGFFFAGWPVAKVAVVAGACLLITRRVNPRKVYREIDFSLLVMFSGLFIVVAGMEKTSLEEDLIAFGLSLRLDRDAPLAGFAAVLSNLVSNVPAVLVFKPLIARLPDPGHAWLVLAMSSTLAGNLTLIGSVANLIVAQRAQPVVEIRFWEYFKVGAPLTMLTLAAGVAWLSMRG